MEFKELVEGLSQHLGTSLEPTEDNMLVLGVDEMTVTLMSIEETKTLSIYAKIGTPPPEDLGDLANAMLNANHLFRGTQGATISRDEDSGDYFLCLCLPMELLDNDSFAQALERFVNTLEIWQKIVADYRPADKAAKSADAAEPPPNDSTFFSFRA